MTSSTLPSHPNVAAPRGRTAPLALALALALAALFQATRAAAQAEDYVVPPGQETLVLDLLGGSDALPGGCRLDGASVASQEITARYACGAARSTLRLRHPSHAGRGEQVTTRFALAPDATFPPALLDAVSARVRQRESAFRWQQLGGDDEGDEHAPRAGPGARDGADSGPPRPPRGPREPPSPPAWPAPLLLGAALAWFLVRGLPQAARGPSRRDALICAALFALALALRLALPWGPADFAEPDRLRALWTDAAMTSGFVTVPALIRSLLRLGVPLRAALHAAGPTLGALNVAGVYLLARSSAGRPAAACAALALLAWPAHAHYAATPGIAVAGPAFWTLAWAAAAWPGPVHPARPVVIAALAGLAAQSRPEMRALVLTLVPLAWGPGWTNRRRLTLAALLAVALVPTGLDVLRTAGAGPGAAHFRSGGAGSLVAELLRVQGGAPWVVLAGVAGFALGRGAPRTLRVALGLACVLLFAQFLAFASEQNPRWGSWRYLVALAPALCVGMALLLETARALTARMAAVVATLTVLSLGQHAPMLARRSDLAAETDFLARSTPPVVASRPDVLLLTGLDGSGRPRPLAYEGPVLMGLALGAGPVERPRDCAWTMGPGRRRVRVWAVEPVLRGCAHPPDLAGAALYVGAYAPPGVVATLREKYDLRPLEQATLEADATSPVYAGACVPAADRPGACTLSPGWYALAPR